MKLTMKKPEEPNYTPSTQTPAATWWSKLTPTQKMYIEAVPSFKLIASKNRHDAIDKASRFPWHLKDDYPQQELSLIPQTIPGTLKKR